MCNLSWTPPVLEKDNSLNSPVDNTQVCVLTVSKGKEGKFETIVMGLGDSLTGSYLICSVITAPC